MSGRRRATRRALLHHVEDVAAVQHGEVGAVAGAVDQLGERSAGQPGQRLLPGEPAAHLERGDPEAVAVLLGQVHHEALVDHRVEQVVGRAARQVARPDDPVERDRVGLGGEEPQHPQGAGRCGDLAHGRPRLRTCRNPW